MSVSSHQDSASLLQASAQEFQRVIVELLQSKPQVRVLITGGTLGIAFLKEIGQLDLPWSKVWMMFSDERFVSLSDEDRNEHQGITAWPELAKQLTRFPDTDQSLELAAASLEAELTVELGAADESHTVFDITVLGMGPDAHVASLFPGHNRVGGWVIAEPDSPKPPSQRLSMSYQALNRSERVWFLASGSGKAWAVQQSLRADSGLPAAMVRGKTETLWFLDPEITDEL